MDSQSVTDNGRPETTLFMLSSVDGKISTGLGEHMDMDQDFPYICGIREGLQQYYDIEQTTDLYSLNSGRVQAKIGVNELHGEVVRSPVSFMMIDNKPHLNPVGVDYFLRKSRRFFLITTCAEHPAFKRQNEANLEILYYQDSIDFFSLFERFKHEFGIERLTIQSGGSLNAIFLREGLIDHLSVVIAPALIGGEHTPSLIDGYSLRSYQQLHQIKALKLVDVSQLKDSYLLLKYDVINHTRLI